MRITGTDAGFAPNTVKMPGGGDSFEKSIQSRIDALQKQLSELSENDDLDPKEKLKRKEEINRQISELNGQLNTRRQEKKQEQSAPMSDERRFDRFERGAGSSMSSLISADVSVGQAETRGSAARALEGRANVLKSEIRQDSACGASTEEKQKEVSELSAKANSAVSAQNDELSEAEKKLVRAEKDEEAEKDEKPGKEAAAEKAENDGQ